MQCPALVIEELEEGPHLWGRQDVAQDFFFHGPGATEYLSGRNQADIFMTSNELKFFEGPDRVYRDYGCTMTSTNCDTNWLSARIGAGTFESWSSSEGTRTGKAAH